MANNAVKKAQLAQKKTNLMFENASIHGCKIMLVIIGIN